VRCCYLLVLCVVASIVGCQRTLYDWGTYENSVYRMYSSRENFSAAGEVDRLRKEVERTQKHNRLIPPGKMAHLGYLYLMTGDSESARHCLETEKTLFPEGGPFMDFLIAKLE
jgi:hypothetical protein